MGRVYTYRFGLLQKYTLQLHEEVAYALSIGAKINDLGWPWPLRALLQNTCVFGAHCHCENMNEDRHTLSAAKMYSPMTVVVSGSIKFVRILRRFPGEGRQTTVGLSKTAVFIAFARYFFTSFMT